MTPEIPLNPKHVIDYDQELLETYHPQEELLIWNHRLGHLPFSNIKILYLLRINPKRIYNSNPPKCEGCIYGAMTNHPWLTKEKQ